MQFRDIRHKFDDKIERNELVLRIQPGEALYLTINAKLPGMTHLTVPVELDMTYRSRFQDAYIPEAYEALILDCLRDEHANFVRDDELEASWQIFTPLLHAIESGEVPCAPYKYGTSGPEGLRDFMGKFGYKPLDLYHRPQAQQDINAKV